KSLQIWLHQALRYVPKGRSGELELGDFESNPMTIKAALDSTRSFAHLPVTVSSPSWLDHGPRRPPPEEVLACRSMLLHLPTMQQLDPTPSFFTTCALDFDYDPDAPEPMA